MLPYLCVLCVLCGEILLNLYILTAMAALHRHNNYIQLPHLNIQRITTRTQAPVQEGGQESKPEWTPDLPYPPSGPGQHESREWLPPASKGSTRPWVVSV
jgi:hypothetical protein